MRKCEDFFFSKKGFTKKRTKETKKYEKNVENGEKKRKGKHEKKKGRKMWKMEKWKVSGIMEYDSSHSLSDSSLI